MAIQTSSPAAQQLLKKAASLAPGTAKTRTDPRIFEIMMQKGCGINGQLTGDAAKSPGLDPGLMTGLEMLADGKSSEQAAALTMLGYQTQPPAKGLTGGSGGLDQFQGNALATLSRLAMEQQAATTQPKAAPRPGGYTLRRAVDKSSVRMAVSKSARHPDDLGHLRGLALAASRGKGFTKREEKLLLDAAGAESKLTEETREASARARILAAGKVLPSTLQRRAGQLSAKYESNNEIDCIGYDRAGGTSYGQFQLASRTGAMDMFVKFLKGKAPDLAARLQAAGPSNTGGKTGLMPRVWKDIAAGHPKRFAALQHEFIRANSYTPAAKSIVLTTGVDVTKHSYALREVLWSTAVQHGPSGAERIFNRAIEKADAGPDSQDFDKSVIEEVYRIRSRKFFRHTKRVRQAVQSRFRHEKTTALALLEGGPA